MTGKRLFLLLCGCAFLVACGCGGGGGCTSVNKPLAAPGVAMEARARNHTRSALAAEPPSPLTASRDESIKPASTRSAIDPNNDGYFVGIAISGGGSRSANFSAACMFQL